MAFEEPEIREVLIGVHDANISHSFIECYGNECEEFVSAMAHAFQYFKNIDGMLSTSEYGAYLTGVAYAALSNHVLSLRLVLLGLIVPAGNLQRYVLECIALALLGSDRGLPMFHEYINNRYSTTKAIKHVIRHHDRLGLNRAALEKLKNSASFYDRYSHPTPLTLATTMAPGKNGPCIVLGGIYDESKDKAYRKEIESRLGLAKTFVNFLEGIERNARKWDA